MHNDNMYPRSGRAYLPTVSEEQKEAQDKTLNEVLEELPLVKKTVERLDKQITHLSSVKAIPAELHTDPEKFMHANAGRLIAIEILEKERSYLTSRVMNTRG